MSRRSLLAIVAAALVAGGAAAEPEFDVAKEDERARLAAIEKEATAGSEAAVYALDELFARLARTSPQRDAKNVPGDMLVDAPQGAGAASSVAMRPLRLCALEIARRLPPSIRKKLIEAQRDAAETEKRRGSEDEELLLRRFPLAPDSCALAWRFAQRAFDSGDEEAALSWDRLAARLATLQVQAPPAPFAAHIRRAAALVRSGDLEGAETLLRRVERQEGASRVLVEVTRERIARARLDRDTLDARRPPEGLIPDLIARYQFNLKDSATATAQVNTAPVAAHVGDLVLASDGSRLLAVDARTGELRGRLPIGEEKETPNHVAPPPTGLPGLVVAQGELVLAPLFFDDVTCLLPARATPDGKPSRNDSDEAAPAVRNGFFSLFAYDASSVKLLWWDGDVGTQPLAAQDPPRGRPAGAESFEATAWNRYRTSHVVGKPVVDGRRVYVPTAGSTSESQLWIWAFERRTGEGGSLVLAPAWATFVSLSSQQLNNQVQNMAVPTVNPRLAVDPEGRVIVQTDQGVLAALDARTGGFEWLRRPADDDGLRAMRGGNLYRSSSDAPLVFPGDGARPSVAVIAAREDDAWLGISCEDGSVLWRSDPWTGARSGGFVQGHSEAPRVAALGAQACLGYGGQVFVAFDPWTGAQLIDPARVRSARLDDRERPSGAVATAGQGMLLVPTDAGRIRKLAWREETPRTGRRIELSLGEGLALELPVAAAPVHVIALEGRVVATTPGQVNVYSWVPRGE